MNIIQGIVIVVLCILVLFFFQEIFLKNKRSCSIFTKPICDGKLSCVVGENGKGIWKCSCGGISHQKCDPATIPENCIRPVCINGEWQCKDIPSINNCNPINRPNCENPKCIPGVGRREGEWVCLDYTKPIVCNIDKKPLCTNGIDPVCTKNGWLCEGCDPNIDVVCPMYSEKLCVDNEWTCGGCDPNSIPDCIYGPICVNKKWVCQSKPKYMLVGPLDVITKDLSLSAESYFDINNSIPLVIDVSRKFSDVTGFKYVTSIVNSPIKYSEFIWFYNINRNPIFFLDVYFSSSNGSILGDNCCYTLYFSIFNVETYEIILTTPIRTGSEDYYNNLMPQIYSSDPNSPIPPNGYQWIINENHTFSNDPFAYLSVGFCIYFIRTKGDYTLTHMNQDTSGNFVLSYFKILR